MTFPRTAGSRDLVPRAPAVEEDGKPYLSDALSLRDKFILKWMYVVGTYFIFSRVE